MDLWKDSYCHCDVRWIVTVLCLYYFSLSHCTVLLCLCRLMLCISVAYAIVRCPSVRLSVCLGVCHVRVFCRNEKTYSQTSFTHHSSFSTPSLMAIFERGPSLTGASNATGVLKMALSTNISLYLGNDTTPCSKKKPSPLMFDNNFGKCELIFKILLPGNL